MMNEALTDNLPDGYTNCDQCMRHCAVESLSCENGYRRYEELTGRPYPKQEKAVRKGYKEMIRRRRQNRGQ